MARRKDAGAAKAAAKETPQVGAAAPATGQTDHGLRRRRQQKGQPAAAAPAAAAADKVSFSDPIELMPWYQYYPWQYGGLTLGMLACVSTLALYDQEDPYKVWKMMGSLGLLGVALLIHETRPFKRMTYADKARLDGAQID